jgi:hypothetical protein
MAVGDGCVRPLVEQEERDYPIFGLAKFMNCCVAPSTSMLMQSTIMRGAIATLISQMNIYVQQSTGMCDAIATLVNHMCMYVVQSTGMRF